jgi:hypothetical protein
MNLPKIFYLKSRKFYVNPVPLKGSLGVPFLVNYGKENLEKVKFRIFFPGYLRFEGFGFRDFYILKLKALVNTEIESRI